jgi:hypothetical protein
MRSACQLYRGIAFVACCLVGACRVVTNDSTMASGGATASAARAKQGGEGGAHAGGAGHTLQAGHPAIGLGEAGQAGGDNEAGAAAGGAADSDDAGASNVAANAPPTECELDGGCASNCSGEIVSCAVESFAAACEFESFHDTPATVTCGQTATVGIANCGACGSVAVEVYYDGSHCWQGVPDCPLQEFFGKLVSPHAPLP